MSEVRAITGYNGNYFVSDDGVVFSRPRRGSKGGALLQQLNSNGYLCVDLRLGKKKKKELVHRLVALAFLENPENKLCVNHKDGNKKNNSVENLEWCSHSDNMKHAIVTGLNVVPVLTGEKHPRNKLSEEEVRQIRTLHNNGATCSIIAKKFCITKRQVYNIIKNKHWKFI